MTSAVKESLKLKAGDFLLHEGDESAEMYFLQSGSLAIIKRKGDKVQQIGTLIAGELVGELSFLDKEPRSASVQAISDSILLVVPAVKLDEIMAGQPKWFGVLLHTLTDRLRRANARIKI